MRKVEIGIYFCVTADTLTKVLQKCSWSSPLPTIWILSKSLILIGCRGNRKVKFLKKIFKNLLLRSHKGDEAELCMNVHEIRLFINYIFYCCCSCSFVAMATWSFHIHILFMGKVEVGIYFSVTADVLTKVLLKCFWSSPLPTIWILSKSLILIGGHEKKPEKLNFWEKKKH